MAYQEIEPLPYGIHTPTKPYETHAIYIDTPLGQLTATVNRSTDYPAIDIKINGVLIGAVEYGGDKGMQVLVWDKHGEEAQVIPTKHDGTPED